MMMKNKKTSSLLLILLMLSLTVSAQWSKGKRNGYYKISAWSLKADQHYTDTGDIDPNRTSGTFNISLYGEYGLTDKLDVIGYAPIFTRVYRNEEKSATSGNIITAGEALNSVGDIDLGLRYGLIKNKHLALSTTLKFGLPFGENSGGSDGSFQTGDGEFNQDLQVDLGVPFKLKNIPAYAKTYLGYNNRTKGFSDEFHYGGEVGLNFNSSKLWLIARLNVVKSTNNGTLNAQTNPGSIFANNIEFNSVGFEAAYYLTKKIGVSANYATATSGRLIWASPSYSAGVFLDLK